MGSSGCRVGVCGLSLVQQGASVYRRSLARTGLFWTLALAAVMAGATAKAASGCSDLRGTAIHPNVSWQLDVKPILSATPGGRCIGCHNGGLAPDVSDTNVDAIFKLVNVYVKPGRPQESRLFVKINCESPDGGGRMPPGNQPLSTLQQEIIYDWIAQGARGESPAGSISRSFIFHDGAESLRN